MGVFGGRDTIAKQEGFDQMIRCNKHFESGLSKMKVIDGATHQLFMNNPDETFKLMN